LTFYNKNLAKGIACKRSITQVYSELTISVIEHILIFVQGKKYTQFYGTLKGFFNGLLKDELKYGIINWIEMD